MKRFVYFILSALFLLLLFTSGFGILTENIFLTVGSPFRGLVVQAKAAEVPVEKIEVVEFKNEMFVDETQELSVTVQPYSASGQQIKYYSTDNTVAKITSAGKITAIGKGNCYICVSCGGNQNYYELTVKVKTEEITVKSKYVVIQPNEQYSLEAKVLPEDAAAQELSYKSMDEAVAVVDEVGTIKALNSGSTAIIVSNVDTTVLVNVIVSAENESAAAPITEPAQDAVGDDAGIDALVELILDSQDASVITKNLDTVSSAALKALRSTEKTLTVEHDDYDISICGAEIVNPDHALSTRIVTSNTEKGLSIEVTEKLPGPISISLKNSSITYRHFYLVKGDSNIFQKLNTLSDNTVIISSAGSYLLCTDDVNGFQINLTWVLVAVGVILLLSLLYILTRRKYWFW